MMEMTPRISKGASAYVTGDLGADSIYFKATISIIPHLRWQSLRYHFFEWCGHQHRRIHQRICHPGQWW